MTYSCSRAGSGFATIAPRRRVNGACSAALRHGDQHMRVRHRIPSIFNLSLVDVLCCALGCAILLWLINAKNHQEDADKLLQSQVDSDSAYLQLLDGNIRVEALEDEQQELRKAKAALLAAVEE